MQEMQETQFQFLGQEDPLEKKQQPTPVFLPGKSLGQKSLVVCSPCGHRRIGHDWATKTTELCHSPIQPLFKLLNWTVTFTLFFFHLLQFNLCFWQLYPPKSLTLWRVGKLYGFNAVACFTDARVVIMCVSRKILKCIN